MSQDFYKLLALSLDTLNFNYFFNNEVLESIKHIENFEEKILLLLNKDNSIFKNSFNKSISISFKILDIQDNVHLLNLYMSKIIENFNICSKKYELRKHQIIFYFIINYDEYFLGKLEINKNIKSYSLNAFDLINGWQSFFSFEKEIFKFQGEKLVLDQKFENISELILKSSNQKLYMLSVFDNFFFLKNYRIFDINILRATANVYSFDQLIIHVFLSADFTYLCKIEKMLEHIWQREIYHLLKLCTTHETKIIPEYVITRDNNEISRIDFLIDFGGFKKWGIEIYSSDNVIGSIDENHIERFFPNGSYSSLITKNSKCCIICFKKFNTNIFKIQKGYVSKLNFYLNEHNNDYNFLSKLYENFSFYIIYYLNNDHFIDIRKTHILKKGNDFVFSNFFKIL